MKHLKLFFALFAMLALGVGNAWAETVEFDLTTKTQLTTQTANSVVFTNGGATLTITKSASGTAVNNYMPGGATNASHTRVYKTNPITFDVGTGNKIQSVTIKVTSSSGAIDKITGGTWSPTVTTSGSSPTITYALSTAAQTASVTPSGTSRIEKVTLTYSTAGGSEPDPTTVTITLDQTTLSLQEGNNATLTATVTGSSDAVTWTSSAPTIATVDNGVVTALTAGETTITAAIGEVKATCTVTVTAAPFTPDPGAGEAGSYTWDLSKNTYTKGTDEVTWTADGIATMHNAGTNATNYLGGDSNNRSSSRFYSNNTLTITPAANVTITSVEFTATSSNYATTLKNSTWSNATASVSGSVVTVTPTNGASAISATVGGTCGFTGVTVNYTKAASDEPQPVIVKTLKSIAVTPTTITYEQGDVFSFDGTCTATYSVTKDGVAQEDETKEVTPTSVSTPDMSTTGDKVITVTYTESEVTVETTYNITVTENTVTPGTYSGNLNNVFFGCSVGNNAEEQSGKLEDILVVSGCTQSATTKTNYQSDHVRYYADNYLKFSAPAGYLITAIQFTAYSSNFKWDGEITATVGTYDADGKSWTGSAQEVQFNFGKQNRIASVSVTYAEASKYALTIATPSNGTLTVKDGENAVATGDKFYAGTQLTVTATPEEGYKLASVKVIDGSSNDVTASVYDNGTLTMPEYDVTISATFEAAKTLTSIEITTSATQTTFWQGETFNYTGLKVTAHFDGAADEVVTPTVTGSTATAGTQTVTVSFTEGTVTKSTSYEITVKAIPNTKETAYSVADAYDIIDKLITAEGVFISGIISQVDSYNSTYKSITYWISADGTTTKQLQVYSGKGLESADFSDKTDLSVGDQVIVCGNLKKFSGTYEFDKNNYLASHTPTTKDPAGLAYATTSYTANVGEAFTTPELTNPHNLDVTYSTSDASKATVDENTGAVTIVAAGEVTITASTTGDATHDAGSASYNITISDPSLAVAQLPFTYNSGKADIETTAGITQEGLGSDYSAAPKLKFDHTGDNIVIRFGSQADELSYDIKGNPGQGTFSCTFAVQESEDGSTYTDLVTYTTLETTTTNKTHKLAPASRYVKFVFTEKSNGNVALGNISITKPDLRAEAGIAWNPATVSLTVGDAFTAPTFTNPNGLSGITFVSDNETLATVDNAGAITLVSGKTGTATITATFADGHADYKPAEATCVITVSPKSEKVVILAQYNGEWYALQAAYFSTYTNRLAALPVNYVGGKLYNVEEADKATIEWQLAISGTKATFKNGENYLTGTNGTDLKLGTATFEWDYNGELFLTDGDSRTFIYHKDGYFRNYATSNAIPNSTTYSNKPVVTAPVYGTGDAYGRSVNLGEDGCRYGTICLPFGSTNFTGAEFFECVGKEEGKVCIASVTTLVAGTPYIFLASATEVAVYGDGTTAATPESKNGLVGTFTDDTEVTVGNYILFNNAICEVTATCWVNANRAYLVMSEVPAGAPQQMPGRRYIGLDVHGENGTTGLDNIMTTDAPAKVIENGQLIIIRNGEKYNVQGVRL